MTSDAQLIRQARHDADAFGELYRRHASAIHAFLRARGPESVALELTAETFAQAALSLGRFRDEADGSAGPWLTGIAKNLLRRYHERERIESRARERLGVERPLEEDLDRVDERARAETARPELAAALASLPPRQREAVRLRVVEELPYAQVASRLGCSALAARIRVSRALGAMAQSMKGVTR